MQVVPDENTGRDYRFRVRPVDLAGNSATLAEADQAMEAEDGASGLPANPQTYLRFEPVASPTLVPRRPYAEGESLHRLVIRSDRDLTTSESCAAHPRYRPADERHVLPPKASQQLVERHGMLEAAFAPDATGAERRTGDEIARRESGSLDTMPGARRIPIPHADGSAGEPNHYVVHGAEQLTAAYLPDPLAQGVVFLGLPGVRGGDVYQLDSGGDHWDRPGPIRLRLSQPDGTSTAPRWDEAARTLDVFLPKGTTRTVRIASRLGDLNEKLPWFDTAGGDGIPTLTPQEFGDTCPRRGVYQARATSAFREYFPAAHAEEPGTLSRLGAALEVDVPSSGGPPPPQVVAVVPTFGWPVAGGGRPAGSATRERRGGGVQVYLARPWFASGDGELLGVVPGDPRGDVASDPYVSHLGTDPTRDGASVPLLEPGSFRNATLTAQVVLPEIYAQTLSRDGSRVTVMGHAPIYDPDTKRWFCDIELDTGDAYFPFLRLALVRYQPHVTARLQRKDPDVKDPLQAWRPLDGAEAELAPTEDGTVRAVTLPVPDDITDTRLLAVEEQRVTADPGIGITGFTSRVVYADTLGLARLDRDALLTLAGQWLAKAWSHHPGQPDLRNDAATGALELYLKLSEADRPDGRLQGMAERLRQLVGLLQAARPEDLAVKAAMKARELFARAFPRAPGDRQFWVAVTWLGEASVLKPAGDDRHERAATEAYALYEELADGPATTDEERKRLAGVAWHLRQLIGLLPVDRVVEAAGKAHATLARLPGDHQYQYQPTASHLRGSLTTWANWLNRLGGLLDPALAGQATAKAAQIRSRLGIGHG